MSEEQTKKLKVNLGSIEKASLDTRLLAETLKKYAEGIEPVDAYTDNIRHELIFFIERLHEIAQNNLDAQTEVASSLTNDFKVL